MKIKIKSIKRKDYVDQDVLMLHACFQIFENFMNEEYLDVHENLSEEELTQLDPQLQEQIKLYNWWQTRKQSVYNESSNDKEDQEMLERLIKIRETLWT